MSEPKYVTFPIAKLLKEKGFFDKNAYGEVRLSQPNFYSPDGKLHSIKDGYVQDDNFKCFRGCIVQGKDENDVKIQLLKSIKVMLMYFEEESNKSHKLSIFRYNKSDNQFWFTIIGLGLSFFTKPKYISKPKTGLWIGSLGIRIINNWKKVKK